MNIQKQKKNEIDINPENIGNEIELIDSPSLPKQTKKISLTSTVPFTEFSKCSGLMQIVKKTASGLTNSGKFNFEESALKDNKGKESKLILSNYATSSRLALSILKRLYF